MSYLLEVKGLSVYYGSKIEALKDATFSIPVGSITAILGPNGAGKSTLVKAILGLEKMQSGQILVHNSPINKKYIIKKVAYISQRSLINTQFPITVFDTVLMGRYAYINRFLKRPGKKDREITKEALIRMQIWDIRNRHISELSGGQLQRAFIARALVQEAELYILDEPLAGVDITTEKIIMDTLKELQKQEKTFIIIHHDLNTVEKYFDYVVWLNKSIIAHGNVNKFFSKENYSKTYHSIVEFKR